MRSLALLCVLASCSEPVTELVVVVDSSLRAGELDTIEIEVDGTAFGADRALRQVRIDARTELPLVLSVRHRGGGPLGIVDIEARGSRAGVVHVRQRTETSFIRDRSLVVYLSLEASCLGEDCRGNETCRAGNCRTARIDPRELPEWPDLGPGEPDAFTAMDAAADAPLPDVPVVDVPVVDAPVLDAPLLDDAHCELTCDGPDKCKCEDVCDSCTLRCSPGEECDDGECKTACVIESRDAAFIDVRCDGERCDVDARGADTVEIDCHRGLCEVDCTDVRDCSVKCGARMCAVRCEDCDIRCDDTCGGVTYCGYTAPCDP